VKETTKKTARQKKYDTKKISIQVCESGAIERNYGLVKENRYRMEWTNTYMGIDNVTMHVIEHDIVLALDVMFDYKKKGKLSPLIKC